MYMLIRSLIDKEMIKVIDEILEHFLGNVNKPDWNNLLFSRFKFILYRKLMLELKI